MYRAAIAAVIAAEVRTMTVTRRCVMTIDAAPNWLPYGSCFARRVADLQIEAVRRRRVIALVWRCVNVAAAARVRLEMAWIIWIGPSKSALHQLRFHLVRIPWRDAERDVIDLRRSRWRRLRRRRGLCAARRGRIARGTTTSAATAAAANDDAADVADLTFVLTSCVISRRPSQQRRIERNRRFV